MQEKKLYAGGIRHSIRLLFSREQRAAGQRDMGVGLSPRPIVLCYFLQNMELEKLMFGKFQGDGLERLSVPHCLIGQNGFWSNLYIIYL